MNACDEDCRLHPAWSCYLLSIYMYESRWFSDLSLLVPVLSRHDISALFGFALFPRVGNPSQLRAVLLRCVVCCPEGYQAFISSSSLPSISSSLFPDFHSSRKKKFLGIHFKSLDRETKREKTAQGEKDADKEGSNKKSRERRVSRMHWSCSLGERCSSAKGYTPT